MPTGLCHQLSQLNPILLVVHPELGEIVLDGLETLGQHLLRFLKAVLEIDGAPISSSETIFDAASLSGGGEHFPEVIRIGPQVVSNRGPEHLFGKIKRGEPFTLARASVIRSTVALSLASCRAH